MTHRRPRRSLADGSGTWSRWLSHDHGRPRPYGRPRNNRRPRLIRRRDDGRRQLISARRSAHAPTVKITARIRDHRVLIDHRDERRRRRAEIGIGVERLIAPNVTIRFRIIRHTLLWVSRIGLRREIRIRSERGRIRFRCQLRRSGLRCRRHRRDHRREGGFAGCEHFLPRREVGLLLRQPLLCRGLFPGGEPLIDAPIDLGVAFRHQVVLGAGDAA